MQQPVRSDYIGLSQDVLACSYLRVHAKRGFRAFAPVFASLSLTKFDISDRASRRQGDFLPGYISQLLQSMEFTGKESNQFNLNSKLFYALKIYPKLQCLLKYR